MVNSELFELFPKHFIDKQLEITYSGGTITNEELFSESMEITESLCSESELRFGSCEASQIKFKIANVFLPMINQTIGVQIKLEGHNDTPFQLGKYKVFSDQPTADRRWRDIVAYDAMYDILNADVAAWYNEILPDMESHLTMREFRKSFQEHFGIAEADQKQELVNDSTTVQRTVDPEELSGKDVITAICEINGCFGHINREGKFAYIYLPQYIQGLYPANDLYPDHAPDYLPYQQETGHLYPQDPKGIPVGRKKSYISCKYEDWLTKEIKRLQIRKEENDIGVIINEHGEGNTYVIQNNFLVYGKGTDELRQIAQNIFNKIRGVIYRPFNAEVQGNPCIEVGDTIRLSTEYEIVESYVLERTLKGIQALRDSFSANGTENYGENLNSTHNSIVELRGKSNVLTRTIEETKSDLRDTEKNLRSTITQTASEIRSEVEKADEQLSSTITQVAGEIRAEVEKADEQLSSTITQVAGEIRAEVKDADDGLSSRISQNTNSITAEVSRAQGVEGTLSASIQINAEGIAQRVAKGNVSSEISQEAGKISIGANRISIYSDYFTLTDDGKITATSGTIGGISIGGNGIYASNFSIDSSGIGTFNGINIQSGSGSFSTGFGVTSIAREQFDSIVAQNATIGNLIADKASVGDLNAVSARLGTVEANYITASAVKADYMEVANWVSAGKIRADKIETSSLKIGATQITGSTQVRVVTLVTSRELDYMGSDGKAHSVTYISSVHTSNVIVLGENAAD